MSQDINTVTYEIKCSICMEYCELKFSVKPKKTTRTGQRFFKCKKCNKNFSQLLDFSVHYRLHLSTTLIKCEMCQDKIQAEKKCFNESMHMSDAKIKDDSEKSNECGTCHTSYEDSGDIKKHIIYPPSKPLECEICYKHLSGITALKAHRRVHTGERPYSCYICQRTFVRKNQLDNHIACIHKAEEPFKCETCEKSFNNLNGYKNHIKIHAGLKLHECDVCFKRFTLLSYLKSHKKIHTGDKPFECDVCKKCFIKGASLKCHRKIHTGEKTFECEVCQKRFRRSDILRTHKKVHTGEKPYECNVCHLRFTQQSSLYRHKRRIHSRK